MVTCLVSWQGIPPFLFFKKKKKLHFLSPLTVVHSLSDSASMSSTEEEEIFTRRARVVAEGGTWLGRAAHLQPELRAGRHAKVWI